MQSTVLEFSTASPMMLLLLAGGAFICWTNPAMLQQLRGGAGRLAMSIARPPDVRLEKENSAREGASCSRLASANQLLESRWLAISGLLLT